MIYELIGKVTTKHIDSEGKITSNITIERRFSSDNVWVDGDLRLGDRIILTLSDGRHND